MARILVVEDERLVAEDIAATLAELGHEPGGIAGDYQQAMALVGRQRPDLVLMDIRLQNGDDGIELAQHLIERHRLPVIYLSSNADSQTLKRAFETAPQAFLTKPFNKGDLAVALELALHRAGRPVTDLNFTDNALFVRKAERYIKVLFSDILYIKSEGSYCSLHTFREVHTLAINSQRFLDVVGYRLFQRVHRSYIVNLANVDGFSSLSVFVGSEEIPVSKSHYPDLMARVKKV